MDATATSYYWFCVNTLYLHNTATSEIKFYMKRNTYKYITAELQIHKYAPDGMLRH